MELSTLGLKIVSIIRTKLALAQNLILLKRMNLQKLFFFFLLGGDELAKIKSIV